MSKTPILSPSDECYNLIKASEGLELEAYPDPGSGGDPWTIGYGSTGPDVRKGVVWTRAQAEARIRRDVARFAFGVANAAGDCTQGELDALVSFSYNVGLGKFRTSTLLKRHLAGDHEGAAREFGKWIKASGKTLPGLIKRRALEAKLYRS